MWKKLICWGVLIVGLLSGCGKESFYQSAPIHSYSSLTTYYHPVAVKTEDGFYFHTMNKDLYYWGGDGVRLIKENAESSYLSLADNKLYYLHGNEQIMVYDRDSDSAEIFVDLNEWNRNVQSMWGYEDNLYLFMTDQAILRFDIKTGEFTEYDWLKAFDHPGLMAVADETLYFAVDTEDYRRINLNDGTISRLTSKEKPLKMPDEFYTEDSELELLGVSDEATYFLDDKTICIYRDGELSEAFLLQGQYNNDIDHWSYDLIDDTLFFAYMITDKAAAQAIDIAPEFEKKDGNEYKTVSYFAMKPDGTTYLIARESYHVS